jgi:hypothetical protein
MRLTADFASLRAVFFLIRVVYLMIRAICGNSQLQSIKKSANCRIAQMFRRIVIGMSDGR